MAGGRGGDCPGVHTGRWIGRREGSLLGENLSRKGRGGINHEKTVRKVARTQDVGLVEIVPPLVQSSSRAPTNLPAERREKFIIIPPPIGAKDFFFFKR